MEASPERVSNYSHEAWRGSDAMLLGRKHQQMRAEWLNSSPAPAAGAAVVMAGKQGQPL